MLPAGSRTTVTAVETFDGPTEAAVGCTASAASDAAPAGDDRDTRTRTQCTW